MPFAIAAGVAVAGALVAAIAPASRALRFLGLLALAVGSAAMFALLSAVFAAAVELVAGGAAAVMIGIAPVRPAALERPRGWTFQLPAVACAVLFAALAYAAWRGGLTSAAYPGGTFNTAAVARLLLDRDALAGVAAGAILLAGIAGGAAAWRVGRR